MTTNEAISKLTALVLHQTDVEGIRQCITMAVGVGFNKGLSSFHETKRVKCTSANGRIRYFKSTMDAERIMKIPHQNIANCCNGKRKSAGGCTWNYE